MLDPITFQVDPDIGEQVEGALADDEELMPGPGLKTSENNDTERGTSKAWIRDQVTVFPKSLGTSSVGRRLSCVQ